MHLPPIMLRPLLSIFTVAFWLVCAIQAHAQDISITKDTVLRAEPRFDAQQVAPIKQGTRGSAKAKQGPWIQVTIGANTGWVLTTELNFGHTAEVRQSGGQFHQLFSRKSQLTFATTTIGCSHCNSGPPLDFGFPNNEQQLMLLDYYAVSKEAARTQHAEPLGLQARDIPWK